MADKPAEIRTTLEQLLSEKQREKVLALYTGLSEQNPLFRWSIQHANYAYGTADVYEYLQRLRHLPLSLWPTRLHRMYCSLAPEKI